MWVDKIDQEGQIHWKEGKGRRTILTGSIGNVEKLN